MNTHLSNQFSLPLRFLIGVVTIFALSLGIFYVLMAPPMSDLWLMALFLTITAVVSAAAGYSAYRLGWVNRSPTIRWTLLGGYVLSSALTFFNVWLTAQLMFSNEHDLLLATVLLIFASGIAMALGYIFSSALTDRIQLLDRAAQAISEGKLQARTPPLGRDEVAELGKTFNQMAARLEEADRKQREAEALRRDLIAWVSHDLQTPLASVQAIIEALADGLVEDPETEQRYLRTAQRNIGSLSLLIDDLFQMAQIDAGGLKLECEYGSLNDLISDTLESFSETAARRGIHMDGELATGVDPVWMDARRIGRVLDNLVSNALRHTPEGGTVQVRAEPAEELVRVEVSDNGPGIPEQDLPLIFERFYRGEKSRSRATGGAGLGLAIAQGFVQAHQGDIGVESVSGEGARFYFTLPRKPRA